MNVVWKMGEIDIMSRGVGCLRSIFLRPTPFLDIKADRTGKGGQKTDSKKVGN